MAINTVTELPITEKKPFMLHAQAIKPPLSVESALSPDGKGMPMGMARGAMRRLHKIILSQRGKPARILCSHWSLVMKMMHTRPIASTDQKICLDLMGLTFPAIRLPMPEYTRNEPITTLAEKMGS